jgi:hypothetical protein
MMALPEGAPPLGPKATQRVLAIRFSVKTGGRFLEAEQLVDIIPFASVPLDHGMLEAGICTRCAAHARA